MKKLISILAAISLIFSVVSTTAFAEVSPQGDKTFKITLDLGVREQEPTFSYVTNGDTYTLIANTEGKGGKFKFVRWEIVGDYEIVSGSLTSETLVIRPLSDLHIVQILEKYSDDDKLPDDDKKPQGDKNDSETSPPTNDNVLFILGGMFLASLLATAIFRKLAK